MADDELVSYWNDVHPPPPPPAPPQWPPAWAVDLEPAKPKPPFCYTCGLPSRICDGSPHQVLRHVGGGEFHRWMGDEKGLFLRQARRLTEEERATLRRKLYYLRTERGESFDQFSAVRGDLIKAGMIPLGRWRIELYREILRERGGKP